MDETQIGRSLRSDIDDLSRRVIALVWERVPGYEPPRIRRDELVAAVRPNLESVLAHVIEPTPPREQDRRRAQELGTARALQGIPLDVVLQSFRAAERVLDDAYVAAASDVSTEHLRSGLHRLAEAFDRLSNWTIDAYRRTQEELTSHYDRAAGDLIAGLVAGDLGEAVIRRQGEALGLEVGREHRAVALRTASEAGLGRTPARLQREVLGVLGAGRHGRIVSGSARGATLFLVPGEIGPEIVQRLKSLAAQYQAITPRIGLGPTAAEVVDAGRSCRRALAAVRTLGSTGLTDYDSVLLEVLIQESDDVTSRLRERLADILETASHLTETIVAYFGSDMSTRDTAEMLHVHPNTVAYRLDRLRDITGFDPRRPRDLMLLVIAEQATRTRSATSAREPRRDELDLA